MAHDIHVRDVAFGLRPLASLQSPREIVRQFTPNWFAATMGTGILALALNQLPVPIPGVKIVAEALWVFNIGLFALFTVLYAARWIFFFDGARRIFGHSVVSMFFGCIPMGLATIINGLMAFGLARWGEGVVPVAEALWWIDVALAVACGIGIPFMMFTRQEHAIDQMTAVWLLPVVAAEVAAVTGGLIAPHLADPNAALSVLVVSYGLWALSVPLAMSILVILVLRMAIHKLPHAGMAASSWLSLGPIGTGALGMLVLGQAAPAIFTAAGLGQYGDAARGIGLIGGLLLWAYGLWWAAMAVLITLRYLRQGLPFNLGWWGYTFPLGVFSVATLKLGTLLPIPAFNLFGMALVAALLVLWLIVGARTVRGAWRGDLFVAPCLAEAAKRDIPCAR
ncbi:MULTISPECIES: TDT family transporter [Brevundimonas]|jgi:C4-dicarboxylate transporter/malic acid transport protein|uniref:TDT family transporter n=1 Tax=Brevundimonas fontaquae TaxID=2813778 RepID=A0ABX7LKK3_9CAUL|nr:MULTISPECIES: TDT family transporter [Brevundimonas]ANC52402.1 C4-dicarboxylate ABC transporter [Brevundimonas sp. GW460-12-10-14-LB2]KQR56031.1 C4-dicarboxylate ABC transporter [Brevundimonas sp. Leaf168]MRL68778.1 C4-dicarboxylate ABC transporter [Brevundimonas sp. SPF441]QIF81687.1 C4-dicarboxylate ABC transporter [Brevundimonas sp. 'scallop']QSF53374.1 TDT family transporter [Brevundimonas fontaquae]